MKKIAITGNIAAGKSAVEKIITSNGYKVIDADYICHEGLNNNEKIISNIKNIFKSFDIIDSNNKIDRIKLGNIIFNNNKYKKQLENIIHPYVKSELDKFFTENQHDDFVFASIPLLFESNMEKGFDKIILIVADEDMRLKRIINRNGCSVEHAKLRIQSQMPQEDKMKLADFIIDNNSDLENLQNNTIKILKYLEN